MKTTTLLFCLFVAYVLTAQPTTKDYETKTIYAVDGKYMLNNVPLTLKEMVAKISKSNTNAAPIAIDAYKEYKKGKTYSTVSGIMLLGGLTMAFISDNNRVSTGIILGSLIPSIIGGRYFRNANRKFSTAIWQYNKEVLFVQTTN